jgi:stage III sporulation protein AG
MLEKFKKMFSEKDEKKKTDNLIAFLIILVITLIVINKILNGDSDEAELNNETGVELVSSEIQNSIQANEISDDYDLEEKLENILSNMNGVGNVKVLLTYSETSSITPLYNETTSSSTTTDSSGNTTETKTESKDVFTDSQNEAVLEKKIMPKLEGAIVIAEGARKYNNKNQYYISSRSSNRINES